MLEVKASEVVIVAKSQYQSLLKACLNDSTIYPKLPLHNINAVKPEEIVTVSFCFFTYFIDICSILSMGF